MVGAARSQHQNKQRISHGDTDCSCSTLAAASFEVQAHTPIGLILWVDHEGPPDASRGNEAVIHTDGVSGKSLAAPFQQFDRHGQHTCLSREVSYGNAGWT